MIKRIFFVAAVVVSTLLGLTSCDKETVTVISFDNLPSAAQNTINTHFDKDDIMLVTYDKEILDKEYIVTFNDATIIEFDKNGAWESVVSYSVGVPESILHSNISDFIAEKYPDCLVVSLEKDTTGYEVTLDNNMELEFNTSGTLIGAEFN